MTLFHKLCSILNLPWMGRKEKSLGEDQLRRRLLTINLQRSELLGRIEIARKRKQARKSLYAEQAVLTNEAHRIELQLASLGPNREQMHG